MRLNRMPNSYHTPTKTLKKFVDGWSNLIYTSELGTIFKMLYELNFKGLNVVCRFIISNFGLSESFICGIGQQEIQIFFI